MNVRNFIASSDYCLLLTLRSLLDKGEKLVISDEMIDEGAVQTPEQGLQAAERIGFPVMIKASGGGGGKGKMA